MFGLLVFVVGAVVLINHLTINFQSTLSQRDRVFAYTKAQAILAEIQSFVDITITGGYEDTASLREQGAAPTLVQSGDSAFVLPRWKIDEAASRFGTHLSTSDRLRIGAQEYRITAFQGAGDATYRIFARAL